mmetsp:Transcript_10513/g.31682  ORF Transcript_10513/g.31682 Transcript_10513/m.31682 type:complete len:461 (+) Transcript_10513:51-1433(+)
MGAWRRAMLGASWTGAFARRTRSASSSSRRAPFLILALDGGGVKGALTLSLLEQLEERFPSLLERVDLVAGTSTGAIIALLLATGTSARHSREMYEAMVPRVFGSPRSVYARFLRAKYDREPLETSLRDYFGGTTLGRLSKKVVIPALRVDGAASLTHSPETYSQDFSQGWRPAVFTNLPAVGGARPDLDLPCVDAALRSAAAPTYFPAYQGYVDGGLFANNPSVVALGKTLLHLPQLRRRDVRVLSVGTGAWPKKVVHASADAGLAQWSPYLLDLLLDASNLSADIAMTYLMKTSRYCRLDPQFVDQHAVALDDANALPRLLRLGRSADLSHASRFLERQVFFREDHVRASSSSTRTRGENDDDASVVQRFSFDATAAIFGHALDDEDEDDDHGHRRHHDDHRDDDYDVREEEEDPPELLAAPRLHSHQWAALVDDAWIDAAQPRPQHKWRRQPQSSTS